MKIGILGGTFDPVHLGHLMLASSAHDEYHLDEVWFVPNASPPHKSAILASFSDRAEMIRLAVSEAALNGEDYLRLKLFEKDCGAVHYSYQTMRHLREEFPDNTYYFIIGADSLFKISTWMRPEILLKDCVLLAASRDKSAKDTMRREAEKLKKTYGADVRFLHTNKMSVSSEKIRREIKNGDSVKGEVPASVAKYMDENSLYR